MLLCSWKWRVAWRSAPKNTTTSWNSFLEKSSCCPPLPDHTERLEIKGSQARSIRSVRWKGMSRCRTEKQKRAELRNDLGMFRDPSCMYGIDRTSEVTSCLSLNLIALQRLHSTVSPGPCGLDLWAFSHRMEALLFDQQHLGYVPVD